MQETPPIQRASAEVQEKRKKKYKIINLSKELHKNQETFPFPGIKRDSRLKIEAEEKELEEMGMSGFSTPIDELLKRFEKEGMKIVLGKNPESGNIFVLPAGSDDIEMDNLFPRHLELNDEMDERLKELIALNEK